MSGAAQTAVVQIPASGPDSLSEYDLSEFKARNAMGLRFVGSCTVLTAAALALSSFPHPASWLAGQVLLAFALLQWFAILHEAGHNTLFRTKRLNQMAGRLGAIFAMIPFGCWKMVHGMHHHWTGWQDLDMTTAPLVPRRLAWIERTVLNLCWKCWLPLFSILYRVNNYWNLYRMFRFFPETRQRRKLFVSVLSLLAIYALLTYAVGIEQLARLVGLGVLLTLVMQDPLILSQHTHIPLKVSGGESAPPFVPLEQEVFTRSLRFPRWFSTNVLLQMDAHELHHMYPRIPGYYLDRLGFTPRNEVHWWKWVRRAKRVPAEVFLFQNRDQSGLDI